MRKTLRPILTCLTLLAMIFGAPGVKTAYAAQTSVGPIQSQKTSPEGLLNADGSLNLNDGFHGALDLDGWSVQIDPQRGPIFDPASQPASGQWANVGVGSNGALKWIVSAIAISGTDVYVGGGFTNVTNNGTILPTADYITKWDALTGNWLALGSNGSGNGSLNGSVISIAVSGTDVYVGGLFTNVNNNGVSLPAADYIAKWNGTSWSALGSNGAGDGALPNFGYVLAIAVSGTNLYVGGRFTNVNNNGTLLPDADYVAKWNGSAWSALGSNGVGDGSLNNAVEAIAVNGTNVYVGGSFTDVNKNGTVLPAADYVARWNGTSWSALGSNGTGNGSLNNVVKAIAVSGTSVYVGGYFKNVTNNNGVSLPAADHIAKWDGTSWSALGSNGASNGSLNYPVYALAVSGTDVYVGGDFTNVNDNGTTLTKADYIAKWNGSTWLALGSNGAGGGSLNNYVNAITVSGANVYVGGFFKDLTKNNGMILPVADYIAKWNGSAWAAMGSNGQDGSFLQTISAVAISGMDVYVGGSFKDINNNGIALSAADYIAKWNGSSWSALGSNGASNGALNHPVNVIAISGTDVYVGGDFVNVNNNGTRLLAADYVARWNGSAWSALGSNGAGNNGSLNNSVFALAVSGKNLYVGGNFTDVNNNGTILPAADNIVKWDGSSWSALGSNGAGNGSLNNIVKAIAVSGTDIYIGGYFTDVNNNGMVLLNADAITKWNGSSWSALGSNGAGDGSIKGMVNAIVVSGADVYVGGYFTDVNNNGMVLPAADYITKWNGSSWSALGSNGVGNGALNSTVFTINVSGTNVYVGGYFKNTNNNGTSLTAADHIAKWNGSSWSALGSNGAGDGALSYAVYALAVSGTNLYVGGGFTNINNNGILLPAADYIAAYGLEVVPTPTQPPTQIIGASPTQIIKVSPTVTVTP